MSFATWLTSCFSRRGKALSLYRTGMAKAEKRDYEGAIADYSAAIELAKIPADVKAMALYNRCARLPGNWRRHEIERGSCGRIGNARHCPNTSETAADQRRKRVQRRGEKANKP